MTNLRARIFALTETVVDDIMKRARFLTRVHDPLDYEGRFRDWPMEKRWFAEHVAELMRAGHSQRGSFRAALAIYNEARTFDEPLPDSILAIARVKPVLGPKVKNTLFTDEGYTRGYEELHNVHRALGRDEEF